MGKQQRASKRVQLRQQGVALVSRCSNTMYLSKTPLKRQYEALGIAESDQTATTVVKMVMTCHISQRGATVANGRRGLLFLLPCSSFEGPNTRRSREA